MFGLKDVISQKPHRKLTALDANDPDFARFLEEGGQCLHHPEEHQILEGKVQVDGRWVNRTSLAGIWPVKSCRHILRAAWKTLTKIVKIPTWSLTEPVNDPKLWEGHAINAVASGHVPEENLRQELQQLGAGGDRYGYITFEGEGQQVPRRIRSAVAHLHAALGHLANDRLVRMLMLSGAGEAILKAARNLRCQVCAMVQPPRDAPQVAYNKPSNFNERISGDTFFVWDCKGKKYGVVHFLDELTDFHVADCTNAVDSTFAAGVLRDQWYGVFGPPDVIVTDGGMEFARAVEVLNDLMGVVHDTIPEGAKWRLGHAERHGGILKLMLLKMLKGLNLDGLDDMRTAVTAACAAKNRLCNHGGVSPLQAVTGRNSLIPASLMTQICSGKMKFVLNQDMDREECLRRAERIRHGAIESFHWLDSHTTLRRALASKSRPPRLEMLKEGAVVYIYDPPANRRGLARRLQDNVSWHGPATVVCVERDRRLPGRIWVRLRGRVKSVPLEKIRLATNEELVSGQFINEALHELHEELTSGKLRATEVDMPMLEDETPEVPPELQAIPEEDSSSGTESRGDMDEDQETDRMRLEKRLLDDVPLQFRAEWASSSADPSQPGELEEPHRLPFPKKQRLFENLAKTLSPPTPLQEARVRGQLERAFEQLKTVRRSLNSARPRPKAGPKEVTRRRAPPTPTAAVNSPTEEEPAPEQDGRDDVLMAAVPVEEPIEVLVTSPWLGTVGAEGDDDLEVREGSSSADSSITFPEGPYIPDDVGTFADERLASYLNRPRSAENESLELEKVIENIHTGQAEYGTYITEVLQQHVLWTTNAVLSGQDMPDNFKKNLQEEQQVLDHAKLVTGKERVEMAWNQLDDQWRQAFVQPIVKGFKVYFDHQALAGVPEGQWVDPQRILPSRLVLTNKGGSTLEEAELKARWVVWRPS